MTSPTGPSMLVDAAQIRRGTRPTKETAALTAQRKSNPITSHVPGIATPRAFILYGMLWSDMQCSKRNPGSSTKDVIGFERKTRLWTMNRQPILPKSNHFFPRERVSFYGMAGRINVPCAFLPFSLPPCAIVLVEASVAHAVGDHVVRTIRQIRIQAIPI